MINMPVFVFECLHAPFIHNKIPTPNKIFTQRSIKLTSPYQVTFGTNVFFKHDFFSKKMFTLYTKESYRIVPITNLNDCEYLKQHK
jgi:hypothetical protein